ncbi:2-iminobutanoate/2-iminopropanoate deaminase [Halobacillus karajensis]|uniref:Enamine/imine deaminase n=1 Tax=Halobacillus karajensis TaxID=195088 RepID=A0A024P4K7_9BACI|nr:RidA family protein [Halobacillus karajensis]CDQ20532.1 Enamine/imine deaminase [Halobacillus karajensis]CDQ23999.1 Enamine/imine deaminase [Halobacillus karajensis]CDQ27477.1 Enamine/imine deaminase [Halobacillus karajensis]SEH90265.1 2-iminobutanoate/2-iminopropanoate deaminase [Halobacillus karajensis]
MFTAVSTNQAPSAIGPYSQATDLGNIIFISGQIPLDPATMEFVSEDVKEQTHQVMKNIQAILKETGLTFKNVVKMNIYLDSMDDFSIVNDVYASYLSDPYPARAAVEVSKLPKGAKVEIEAIAFRK